MKILLKKSKLYLSEPKQTANIEIINLNLRKFMSSHLSMTKSLSLQSQITPVNREIEKSKISLKALIEKLSH